MKRIITSLFILSIFLMGLRAQDNCGLIVEMKGAGMQVDESALLENTLTFDDVSTIEYIVVEAIYKSDIVPEGTINFTSSVESVDVSPVALEYYTKPELDSYNPHVFREIMQPAESITLNNTINNPDGIWSFAAYVYRKTEENMMSMAGGEHAYYYVNGMDNPALQYISIPAADAPRDIIIHMGITELNNDTRVGYFTFTAGSYEEIVELNTYDPDLGISYAIEEVTLPDVPGDVTEIVVSGFSPDVWVPENNMYNGDSYIGGRLILTLPCEPEEPEEPKLLCSYTQGFYGNAGGKTCWGQTTTELLMELLSEDLVIGGGDNTLTIQSGHVECLYLRLPGGGPSAALNGHATCDDPVGITLHKKGTFKNTLLNQTITAALNFRLSPDLNDVALEKSMMVADIENCRDSEPKMVNGSEHEFHMPSSVVDYLGEDATLGMVLDLANLALSGEDMSPLSLSEIGDAVAAINEGFDECKGLVYCRENEENECKEDCEKENNDEGEMNDDEGEDDGEDEGDDSGQNVGNGDGDCDCSCDCDTGEEEENDEAYEEEEDPGEGNDEGEEAVEEENDQEGMQGSSESNVASQIYPNPVIATGIIELRANNSDNAHVAIYDLNGKQLFVLYDNNINAEQIYRLPIPVNELRRGLYILKIVTSNSMQTKVFSVAK